MFNPVLATDTSVSAPEALRKHPHFYSHSTDVSLLPKASVEVPAAMSSLCRRDAINEARAEYEAVQAAYDRAVTLCQTRQINAIWPALRTAKARLLAAEASHGV